ncbi:la-related protein 1C-like [Malania oleifera]|uniref:la-related protein 1C-like n=1 Tax=Malania oleifera TaxID=397392 RepID=UPI0025AE133D|nr:la-related protein 1C-like [Malania oleifera]
MAAAANSSAATHSPRYPSSVNNLSSPQSRRASRDVSSPWAQIVRGGESESISAAPSSPSSSSAAAVSRELINPSSDCLPAKASTSDDFAAEAQLESPDNANGSGNAGKKPAWNKPSNGAVAVEVGPVMGAVSWPALSESARTSAKSPSESLKPPADGASVAPPQGAGIASSSSPSSQKQVINNANPNSTPNHALPACEKSTKCGGASTPLPSNNGVAQVAAVSSGAVVEIPPNNPSPIDHTHKNTNWDSAQRGSQSHSSSDHPQQRGSFRRGNGSPHPRGDGSYHHNYGARRDHDRGNHDWNPHRNYNSRDTHMQPQRGVPTPRGFIRPSHHSSTFITPPPVRPFGSPIGFEVASPPMVYIPHESFRGVPFFAPVLPHAMIFPAMDAQLHAKMVTQIEYYFSNDNLIKDAYLRQNMDEQGWVPIKLIAGFNKVKNLTDNIQLILDALRTSNVVEVQGAKVRKRNDWMRWVMRPVQFPIVTGSQTFGRSSNDMLAARVQGFSLEERTEGVSASSQADIRAEALLSRSLSGDIVNQPQPSSSEVKGRGAVQIGSDSFISSRNSSKRELC